MKNLIDFALQDEYTLIQLVADKLVKFIPANIPNMFIPSINFLFGFC